MLVVETIAKIRRAYFLRGKAIKEICRELRISRKVVRKVIRTGATEFRYERSRQPMPRLGVWRERLEASLEANAQKPPRDRLTLVRIFEDMQGLGFDGSYAALRRYAVSWREQHSSATSTAYIPLTFAPGEAYQFDSHGALPVKSFCCSRVRFCRTPVSRGMSGFDCSGRCMRVRMSPIAVGGKSGERETGVKDAQQPAKPACAKRMSLTRVSSSRRKCCRQRTAVVQRRFDQPLTRAA